jgi:hypothetical protein
MRACARVPIATHLLRMHRQQNAEQGIPGSRASGARARGRGVTAGQQACRLRRRTRFLLPSAVQPCAREHCACVVSSAIKGFARAWPALQLGLQQVCDMS